MIIRPSIRLAVIAASLTLIGCGNEPTPATPPAPKVTPPTGVAPAAPAAPAIPAAPTAPAAPAAPAAVAPAVAPAPAAPAAPVIAPAALSSDTTAKATALLEQAIQYVKDNKLELADKALAQLDAIKASLPESLQQQIESLRGTLTAKKAAGLLPAFK